MADDEAADGLAVINVEQLSRDVNAIVQATVMVDPQFDEDESSGSPPVFCSSSRGDDLSPVCLQHPSLNSSSPMERSSNLDDSLVITAGHLDNSDKPARRPGKALRGQPSQSPPSRRPRRETVGVSRLRPILPASLLPGGCRGQRSLSNPEAAHIDLVSSQMEYSIESSRRSGYSSGSFSQSVQSSQNGVADLQSSMPSSTRSLIRASSSPEAIPTNDPGQLTSDLSPPGPLNVQVPPTQGGLHPLSSLNNHAAQNLLAQLALLSPSNPENVGSGQSQGSNLQSLLSPQSTILPYLLRTMASLSQSTTTSAELNLLTDAATNGCGELMVAVPEPSSSQTSPQIVAFPAEQDMNTALAINMTSHGGEPSLIPDTPASNISTSRASQRSIQAEHSVALANQVPQPNQEPILLSQQQATQLNQRQAADNQQTLHLNQLALQPSQPYGQTRAPSETTSLAGELVQGTMQVSTLAPSIITSSIHSLCLPFSGVTTSAQNAVGVTAASNNTVNVISPVITQNGTVQLTGVVASRGRSINLSQGDLDLQSLAMQISDIPSTARHQAIMPPESSNMVDEFWCAHCDESMPQVCPRHGPPTVISDTPIQTRARMTLPSSLYLKRSTISKVFMGVWSKVPFKAGCQFGPMEGIYVKKLASDADALSPYIWKIFQKNKVKHYLDVKNEDVSNWMMFVRRARKHEEQNIAAHQMKGKIYYTTKREIKPGEELLLWFNKEYANLAGATLLPEDSFKCALCGRQFSYRQELEGHMQYRHPSVSRRKHTCKVCGKAFPTSTKLNLHTLKHTGDKPYSCKICPKSFTDGSNLRRHARIHSGEKQFQCSVCLMSFRQKAHLVTHSVVHTGEKKIKCQYCGRLFARKSDIRQHLLLHSEEKKHKCPMCPSAFVRKQHLKSHLVTHTKESNFACDYCQKTYQTEANLWRHTQGCSRRPLVPNVTSSQGGDQPVGT